MQEPYREKTGKDSTQRTYFKENAVKEAIEKAGLEVVEINHQGEWVNITARKN